MTWQAEFWRSFAQGRQLPGMSAPELAMAGRSNVGKSSLLNALCNRRKLARTSGTPGRTQLINFFAASIRGGSVPLPQSPDFWLVDLPGYGYARVSATMRHAWGRLIDSYLQQRLEADSPFTLLHLVDARQRTDLDRQLAHYIEAHTIDSIVVCTKTDKLKQSERSKLDATVRQDLGLSEKVPIFQVSATSNVGVAALRTACEQQLGFTL